MHAHSFTDYIDGKVQPNKERSDCNRMLAQGGFFRPLLRPGEYLIKDVIIHYRSKLGAPCAGSERDAAMNTP
jgi:hypothetical protein